MATQQFPVPTMGDSITEGTLLEWSKGVGEYVELEQSIASIETDKVTVDVKSPASGTITALFAEVDGNVLVGAPLLEIDVGVGEAGQAGTGAAPTPAPPAAATAAPTASAPAAPPPAADVTGRIHASGHPSLISFPPRGIDAVRAATAAPAAAATPAPAAAAAAAGVDHWPASKATITYAELPLRFRPQPLGEEEMEAVMSGGADQTY